MKGQPTLLGLVLLLIVGLLGAQGCLYYMRSPLRFPIRHIHITASYEHLTRSQLEALLVPFEPYSFFMLPLSQLRHTLYQHPWVHHARVKRHYPDTIILEIQEKHPIATWNSAFLSDQKEIFSDPSALAEALTLPHLIGPPQELNLVLRVYQKLNSLLAPHQLAVKTLQRRDNHAWSLTLTNGIHLKLGKKAIFKRIKRFMRAYPAVVETNPTRSIQTVDLRYPDGLTVRYR